MQHITTLGIDLGTNSLGWCLIETHGEPGAHDDGRILALGTRIFAQADMAGRDPKSKASLAVARREARSARRRRDRTLKRRTRLLEALTRHGLMPADEASRAALIRATGDGKSSEPKQAGKRRAGDLSSSVYALRARALDQRLEPHEIGRVLFQLSQRRGFKSNRKTDSRDNEAGKIATGVSRLHHEMTEAGAKTYGAYLNSRRIAGKSVRTRLRPETGEEARGDGYDFYPSRGELKQEFDAICAAQAMHHPSLLADETIAELRAIIFFQRPLKPVMPGKCSYNPAEARLAKAHPLFQAFRLMKEVNELAIIGEDQVARKLTPDQRDALLLKLKNTRKATWKALRKVLKLGAETRFNKETDTRKHLEVDVVHSALSHKACFGPRWGDLPMERQWQVVAKLRDEEDRDALIAWLRDECGLSRDAAERTADTPLPEGYGRLGPSALTSLLDALKNDVDDDGAVITEAAAAIKVYGRTNAEDDPNRQALDALPPYQEVLERHIPPGTGNPDDIYDIYKGRITNPTVHIALNQLRRVVNALIARHGKPDRIAIELGRELKLNEKQRDEVNRLIGKNTREAERRSGVLTELGIADTGYNRMRLKLWEELSDKPEARVCVYSGEPIAIHQIFSAEVDVDHILPYSKTLDDSQSNRLLCKARANRQKNNRAPADVSEWQGRYDAILARATALPRNKQWRFGKGAMQRFGEEEGFLARQLTDMQHTSRLALSYLAALYPAEEADIDGVLRRHRRVRALPGRMTEMLRRTWGLNDILHDHNFSETGNPKNRKDHRHHAIDAAVIACTSQALIQRLATASAQAEDDGAERVVAKIPEPWTGFRDELRQKVQASIVSHKPDHGTVSRAGYGQGRGQTAGKLHNDTAYGPTGETDDKGNALVVRRKPLSAFTEAKHLDAIRDRTLYHALWEATRDLTGKAFERALVDFSNAKMWDGRPNPFHGLRHIRVLEVENPIWIKGHAGTPYKGYLAGGNYRYDVWELTDGRWEAEVVSMFEAHQPGYVSTFRQTHHNARKVLSLMKGDMVAYQHPETGERVIARVRKFDQRSKQLYLDPHNEAGNLEQREKDREYKPFRPMPNPLKKVRPRQLRIDEIGQVFDPGPRGGQGGGA